MTTPQLWGRAHTLCDALRFRHSRSAQEREVLINELDSVLREIEKRGVQLALC